MNKGTADVDAAQQKSQADEPKEKLLATLSTEELASSSCRVSERLGRRFSSRIEYENKEALNAAFDEVQKVFPVAPDAYKPAGRTTALAVFLMVASAPVLLVLMTAIAFGLCWGWGWLEIKLDMPSHIRGLGSIFLDLILVILMVAIPTMCYQAVSKISKNRNPLIPAVLTGVVDLILAIILFIPVWHGETLAPTHLTFLFVPIRWILILIGGALVPFIGAIVVHGTVSGQKFCETSGLYLKKFRKVAVSLDYAENALALLGRRELVCAVRLPIASEEQLKTKHIAEISLWWHEQARIAFLEMEIQFHGQLAGLKASKREESKKQKSWRAFSAELDGNHAEVLAREMKP